MIGSILGALFPIFGLVALGYLCARLAWLGEGSADLLSAFVARITLPVLTFHILATMDAADILRPSMILVVVGSSVILFSIQFMLERRLGSSTARANVAALGASYGNSAFVGLPICLAIIGPESLGPAAVVMALNSLFIFGGGAVVAALVAPGSRPASAARQILANPLIVGAAAGVACSLTELPLAGPLDSLLRTLGGATAPCALVAIGMVMSQRLPPSEGTGATWRAVAGKLMLLPAITFVLLLLLPPVPAAWWMTAMIMSAVPAASSNFILAMGAGEAGQRLAARQIILSTVGAAFTLPVLLVLLGMNAAGGVPGPGQRSDTPVGGP